MKVRAASILLCLAILVGSLPVGAAQGAGFRYGSVSVVPGGDQALLTYRALEDRESQLCNLATFICDPAVTSIPPVITGEIAQGGYTLSPSGKLALVEEAVRSGGMVRNLYQVTNGRLAAPKALPVTGHIFRIIFTPDESRAVVRTATALISLDLKANTVLGMAPWNSGDFFSFPQISPDARFVAYYHPGTQSAPERRFRIVDIFQKKTRTLSETLKYWDLLSEENMLFQFSPDGKFLLYKDDRHGPQTLYRVDLAKLAALKGSTFQGTRLFTKSYTVSDFILTNSRTLLYLANRATPLRFDLYSYDLVSGALKTVMTDVSYHPPLQRSGDLVFVNRLTSAGSQVMAYNANTGVLRPLPAPSGNLTALKPGTDVTLPGGLHGALLLPDNFNPKAPHKLVVWLHGGPYRQTSPGYHPYASYGVYDWMLEGLRASGVVVLKLDYTGSFGYGRPFAESLQNNVGVKDLKDVLTALAWLKSRYNLSETHLMGVSYGAYLALRSLVERPAAFASAISINGVSDWLTLVNNDPNTIFAADFRGPLTIANQNLYDQASIWAKLPGLGNQKVVLLHSTKDSSVSFSQSTKLEGILKTARKNVELIRLEGDDHVLGFKESAKTVCEAAFRTVGVQAGDKCSL